MLEGCSAHVQPPEKQQETRHDAKTALNSFSSFVFCFCKLKGVHTAYHATNYTFFFSKQILILSHKTLFLVNIAFQQILFVLYCKCLSMLST